MPTGAPAARSSTSAIPPTRSRCASWRSRCCRSRPTYVEYRTNAAKVRLVDITAAEYYGTGYQDVENRVPKIDNTRTELDWTPRVTMQQALRQIFDAYRGQIAQARQR